MFLPQRMRQILVDKSNIFLIIYLLSYFLGLLHELLHKGSLWISDIHIHLTLALSDIGYYETFLLLEVEILIIKVTQKYLKTPLY